VGLWSGLERVHEGKCALFLCIEIPRQLVRVEGRNIVAEVSRISAFNRRTFCFGCLSALVTSAVNGNDVIVKDNLIDRDDLASDIETFKLSNRRYIGCKQKLLDWIFEQIRAALPSAQSLFDVFSGTGVVAERALQCGFKRVIVNDLLYSNGVIYKGFLAPGKVSAKKLEEIVRAYNAIDLATLPDNYFSENFGDKYFEIGLARLIGYIREDIDNKAEDLTEKERAVLLSSLLYSIDAHANTCGHFEAYIKKPIPQKEFSFRLIEYRSYDSVSIYREDSNMLAEKITADIAYIDPPYNSRQYSRFYHARARISSATAPVFALARDGCLSGLQLGG